MDGIKKFATTVSLVLIVAACGTSTDAVSISDTTVTIAGDSEWQIPPGFSVVPTPATLQSDAMSNDRGPPPDLPDFSMKRDMEVGEERERVLIIVWADGESAESDPKEVLVSWTEGGLRLAEYDTVVVKERFGLQSASWRGQAQAHGQPPQGLVAAVISHPETQRVWRLTCFVTSEEVSDEVSRICDQFQAQLRPL